MADEFSSYQTGLKQLRKVLPSDYPSGGEFFTLEARLHENITAARAHGDTETLRHERSRIVHTLNVIAEAICNVPFVDLCPDLSRADNLEDHSLWMHFPRGVEPKQWRRYTTNSPHLVGRRDKLERLHDRLQYCVDGRQPDLVLLRGEPGIGKTRLLAEFCEEVENRGIAVCGFTGVRGVDADLASVLSLVGQIWYSPAFEARESVIGRVPGSAGSLENLIQRLSAGLEPTPSLAWDAIQNLDLFQVAWGLLGTFAQEKPIVLTIDDLHYANSHITEFLGWVDVPLSMGPILILGSFSPTAESTPIKNFAHTYVPSPIDDLTPLSGSDTLSLVRSSVAGEPLPYDLCRMIARKSGGNPYFALELVKALTDRGLIYCGADNNWHCQADLREIDSLLPRSLEDLARFRCEALENLVSGARMDARRAAVIGQQFWFKVLHRISPNGPAGEMRLGRVLGAMTDQQLISPLLPQDALRTDRGYYFQSPVYWQSLYEDSHLPIGELHKRIAELLDELYEDPEAKRKLYFWRAWHYERAGKVKEAVSILERAGREAEQGARPHQAIWFLERLLDHVREHPRLLSKDRNLDLLARMAKLYAQLGWLDKAAEHYDQALKMSEGWQQRRIDLMIRAAWVRVKQGRFEDASRGLEEALNLCDRRTPAHTWSLIYRHFCALHLERLSVQADLQMTEQDIQQAYRYAQKSKEYLGKYKDLEDPERQMDRALVLNNFGRVYFFANQYDNARQVYEESLDIAERLGNRALAAYMLNNLGGLEAKFGNPSNAICHLKESLKIADQEDNLFLRCKSLLNLGTTYSNEQPDEAKQYLEEAYWIACVFGNPYLLFDTCINLGFYYNNIGDLKQARRLFLKAGRARPDNPLVEHMLAKIQMVHTERSD